MTIGASLILIATVLGIGWWFMSLRQQSAQLDRDIARAEAEAAAAPSGARAGAEVRGAQGAAHAARHAHRAASPRPVGAGPRARRSQQEPSRTPVADGDEADGRRTSRSAGSRPRCRRSPTSSRISRRRSGSSKPVEILDSQVQPDAKAGDLVKFSIRGDAQQPGAAARAGGRPAGRGRPGAKR